MQTTVTMDRAALVANLRRQHLDFERHGDHAHNRRGGLVTVHDLRRRRVRRTWNQRLRAWALGYN